MNVHFSSETDNWATPQNLFDSLNNEFNFTLDPCCSESNAKCEKRFTVSENGLEQDWSADRVFMNPPYGRAIKEWMRKAYEESLKGSLVVCLVPARTDTSWWHEYAIKGQIRFLRGRIKFGGQSNSAPFPSAVVVFGQSRETERDSIKNMLNQKGLPFILDSIGSLYKEHLEGMRCWADPEKRQKIRLEIREQARKLYKDI